MQISELKAKQYLYGIVPFAAFWYYFFSSSFVLRVYPDLFWAALMCLGVLAALAVKYKLSEIDAGFLLSLFGLVFVGVFSGEASSSLNYSMYFAIYYVVAAFLAKAFNVKLTQKQIYFFCLFHLICVFIQVIAPQFYTTHMLPLLPAYVRMDIVDQMNYNSSYYGLTVQTSITALYLSIGALLSCLYTKYAATASKRTLYSVISMLFVIGLFFTTRRGSTVVTLIIMLLVYFKNSEKKLNKVVFLVIAMAIIGCIGFEKIPGMSGLVEKTEELVTTGRFMNGRDNIWGAAINAFLERPFTGYGVGNASVVTGGHRVDNAYLNALVERGVIGTLILFLPYYLLWAKQRKEQLCSGSQSIEKDLAYYFQLLYFSMSLVENYFGEPITMFIFFVVVFQADQVQKDR